MIIKTKLPSLFGVWAITVAPFIFVLPEHFTNNPLIEHEKVHYKEQVKWLTVPWWIAYLVSRTFRKNAEVRGYKRQIALGGCTVEQAGYWLYKNYMLGISREEAVKLLTK